jgi:hypothetical protein
MGFDSGTVSFRKFAVVGTSPKSVDQELLDAMSAQALRPTEMGVPEDVEYGWSGGRHILDGTFSFETNAFSGGEVLHAAMRVDTNRVPAELKRAYKLMEEEAAAAGNPSGLVSRKQKRDARDVVRRKLDDDLRSGQYRRSRLTNVLWDLPNASLYAPATPSAEEKLRELFERTFGLELEPVSASGLASRLMERRGRRRDYEDARPTRFVIGPEGEGQTADYPWTAKNDEAKDYFGNEFLMWLWHEADRRDGYVPLGDEAAAGPTAQVAVLFDRALELDCVFGATGKAGLRSAGPTKMPEACEALRSGKVPRRCGLTLEHAGAQYVFMLNAETLAVTGLKLPEVTDADTPRTLFDERITQLRDFGRLLEDLFAAFVRARAGSAWEGATVGIRKWIGSLRAGGVPVRRMELAATA